MPLYEFACEVCAAKFERLMSFESTSRGVSCPSCGSGQPRRLISTFAALSRSGSGETRAVAGAGGGCACSTGGGCGCCS